MVNVSKRNLCKYILLAKINKKIANIIMGYQFDNNLRVYFFVDGYYAMYLKRWVGDGFQNIYSRQKLRITSCTLLIM